MANNFDFPLLFKYLRADHVIDFYKRGMIKIGTLYEYRDFERYGPEIGDQEEGIKCIFSTDSVNSPSDVESNPVLKRIIINPGGQINICGARFELREKSLDLYIYSMTESFDPHIARNLGYDACIIIEQPKLFLSSINESFRSIEKLKEGFAVGRCQYTPKTQMFSRQYAVSPSPEHSSHPALIKDIKYSYQKKFELYGNQWVYRYS